MMNVLSKVRDFFERHRNKLVVTSVAVGGSIFLFKYAQRRLTEWQDRETREFLDRTRKQQHFETIERTCNQTILDIVPTLNEALQRTLDTEKIVAQLRDNPTNKIELWDELKVLVLVKATCLIYTSVILVVTLRIQLNIIGGYLYKDANSIATDIQEHYLMLFNNVFDDGLQELAKTVKLDYASIVGELQLKTKLKLRDFDNIFWGIQSAMSTKCEQYSIRHYLIRGNYLDDIPFNGHAKNSLYKSMVVDTVDLLESDEIKQLMTHCISRGFATFSDQLAEYFMSTHPTKNGFVHPVDVEMPFAKLIPIINGLISKGTLHEQVIAQLIVNDRLKTLGANIYECFSQT